MDPFTHYIVAYYVGKRYSGDGPALRVITLSALFPDFDAISILWGIDAARSFHGTIVHSLFVIPILALGLSAIVYAIWRINLLKWAMAGVFMHFALDLANVLNLPSDGVFNPLRPLTGINLNPRLGYPVGFVLWILSWGTGLAISLYLFAKFVKKKEPPWREWFDGLKSVIPRG